MPEHIKEIYRALLIENLTVEDLIISNTYYSFYIDEFGNSHEINGYYSNGGAFVGAYKVKNAETHKRYL